MKLDAVPPARRHAILVQIHLRHLGGQVVRANILAQIRAHALQFLGVNLPVPVLVHRLELRHEQINLRVFELREALGLIQILALGTRRLALTADCSC